MPVPTLLLAALAALSPTDASAAPDRGQFALPIGEASLDDDYVEVSRLMGDSFRTGVRSGANSCYVNALMRHPGLAGDVHYTMRTPPGEGYYLTTVEGSGAIGDEMPQCIREVLHEFYHYTSHPSFERLQGTLHFKPHTIPAPPLPTDADMAPHVEARYARQGIVRVQKIEWLDGPYRLQTDSSEALYRGAYRAELEFVEDGFETTCRHYTEFKVFSRAPFQSRAAGTSCASSPRRVGDRVHDDGSLMYRLVIYPKVANAWEYRGE
jgi:hypothetical protein